MKIKFLVVVGIMGMTGVWPAHGFPYWNNATFAARFRPVAAKPSFQIAVVKSSEETGPNYRGVTSDHPWGPPRPYAVKSH